MTLQSRKTIIAALVSQIRTEVTDFKLVTDIEKHQGQIATGQYPACLVLEGPDYVKHAVSRSNDIELDIGIVIKTQGDDIDTARDLTDAVIDAIAKDTTLGGTCMRVLAVGGASPFDWPENVPHTRRRVVRIKYRRTF